MSRYVLNICPLNKDILSMYKIAYKGFSEDTVEHNLYYRGDAGLDIFFPNDHIIPPGLGYKIKLGIRCCLIKYSDYNLGLNGRCPYLLTPRSSIIKTPLRMSNSIGIIDSGYNGELIAVVDNHSDLDFSIKKGDRLFQIVRGNLGHFDIKYVNKLEETDRGDNGFGSTG